MHTNKIVSSPSKTTREVGSNANGASLTIGEPATASSPEEVKAAEAAAAETVLKRIGAKPGPSGEFTVSSAKSVAEAVATLTPSHLRDLPSRIVECATAQVTPAETFADVATLKAGTRLLKALAKAKAGTIANLEDPTTFEGEGSYKDAAIVVSKLATSKLHKGDISSAVQANMAESCRATSAFLAGDKNTTAAEAAAAWGALLAPYATKATSKAARTAVRADVKVAKSFGAGCKAVVDGDKARGNVAKALKKAAS